MTGLLRGSAVVLAIGAGAADASASGRGAPLLGHHHRKAPVPVTIVGVGQPTTETVVTSRRLEITPTVNRTLVSRSEALVDLLAPQGLFAAPQASLVYRVEYLTDAPPARDNNTNNRPVVSPTAAESDALAKAIQSFNETLAKSTEARVKSDAVLAAAVKDAAATNSAAAMMRAMGDQVARPMPNRPETDIQGLHDRIMALVKEQRMDEARALYWGQAVPLFRALQREVDK